MRSSARSRWSAAAAGVCASDRMMSRAKYPARGRENRRRRERIAASRNCRKRRPGDVESVPDVTARDESSSTGSATPVSDRAALDEIDAELGRALDAASCSVRSQSR